jgi:EmrB/QacA subfamily drug resistance transporter
MTDRTEAPPGAPIVATVTSRKLLFIMAALMLGMFLAALDQTIVSTALPTIVGDLHGKASQLSWVVVAYLLASTVSTPLWGKLGDLYGRKRLFQGAICIFLVGSILCGLSQNLVELIGFRALQGLGGGGLLVGAQAIIGDVVPPRDRGRYSGFFGATFGVATVLGPLAGGLLVEYASWRWVFYVNLPIGVAALVVTGLILPASTNRVQHAVDYAGILTLTIAATAVVLYASLGGTTYGWGEPGMIAVIVIGILATVAFLSIERRAEEPVLPPRLFKNRTFSVASAIGFVVGFAMFGALTFLPIFLQYVRGVSPIESGLWLLPMMLGLLGASITSGLLISRGMSYRRFPIQGTAMMVVGLALMSTINMATNNWVMFAYMFIFGIGLGQVMQVLVLAVQNAVDFSDLGTATAGANFFRSIGGSFGTAIFGAIYANVLVGYLPPLPPGVHISMTGLTPAMLHSLPESQILGILDAMTKSIQAIYRYAIPVAIVAFILSFFLPAIELRRSVATPSPEPQHL